MAGTVKKLQFSEGTDVGAPSDLSLQTSTSVIIAFVDDAAYVTAQGPAANGSVYLNSTIGKFRYYLTDWRNSVPESDLADSTKRFLIDSTGNSTGVTSTLDFNNTANRIYTFPNFSGTMATLAGTESFSNKTLVSPILTTALIGGGSLDVTGAGNVTIGASVGANNLTLGGASSTVVIAGDLIVQGNSVTLNTSTLDVEDLNVTVNKNGNDASSEGAGLTVDRTSTKGSFIFASALASKWKLGLLGSEIEVVDVSSAQTFTNKSHTAPIFLGKSTWTEISTPANPSAGTLLFYPKSDDKFYSLNSAGVETQIGSGTGTGGINYISNSDFEATANAALPVNWSQYNDGSVAIPVDGTGGSAVSQVTFLASNSSPVRGTISAVLTKDANNRQGVGYSFPITLAAVDKSKKLNISCELTVGSGTYVNGDLAFYVYDVTNSTIITPTVAAIPGITNKWAINFDSTTSTSYRLCIHIASTSALAYTMKFDTMSVDPGLVVQGAAISEWQSYTPVTANAGSKVFTNVGRWRRVADSMEIMMGLGGNATAAGAGASEFSASIPTGYTINATALPSGTFDDQNNNVGTAGTFGLLASGQFDRTVQVRTLSSTTVKFHKPGTSLAYATSDLNVANAVNFNVRITVPIAEWAGSGTVNLGPGAQVEYASNSGNVTAANGSDTTSFLTGSNGTPVLAYNSTTVNATTNFLVQFSSPIQPDDLLVLEFNNNGRGWFRADETANYMQQGTSVYGAQAVIQANPAQVNVIFGNQGLLSSNATYAGSGTAWSALSGYRWRLRKVKASSPVGFGMAGTDGSSGLVQAGKMPGLTTGAAVAAGYVGEVLAVAGGTGGSTAIGTSAALTNISSVALTPGRWEVTANIYLLAGATTAWTFYNAGISLSSANFDSLVLGGFAQTFSLQALCPTSQALLAPLGSRIIDVGPGGTTVYLVAGVTYTVLGGASYNAGARMTAKRIG